MPALKELCEETLGECLTAINVIDVGILAEKVEAKQLIKTIVRFVKNNFVAVFEKDDIFRKMPRKILFDIYTQK